MLSYSVCLKPPKTQTHNSLIFRKASQLLLCWSAVLPTGQAGQSNLLLLLQVSQGITEAKMPRRKGPSSLRAITLKQICDNFELICYGVPRRSPGFRHFIKHGKYLSVRSPLKQLPVHVLSELVQVVLDQLGTSPHILHAVIQPQLTSCRLPSVISTVPLAIKLLVERTHKLHSFELSCCKVDGRMTDVHLVTN